MRTAQDDQLFTLIKSMSKAEKRNFKLYANRIQSKGDVKFIQLFDVLDRLEQYEEAAIYKKLRGLKSSQLSNLKRHLYKQLLISLRLIHIQKNVDIQIREQIDFARILYGKGLYLQSLKLLDRIKPIAAEHYQDLLLLEILEFEKLIEERHITRSRRVKGKVEKLIDQAAEQSRIIDHSCQLTNLKIKIHGWYIQIGHVKNEKDRIRVEEYFKSNLPKVPEQNLTFFERIYLYQSYVWYHYILLDFEACLEYALHWIALFDEHPALKAEDPDLYMRGLHYALTSLYNMGDYQRFVLYLKQFEDFEKTQGKHFNTLSRTIAFLYIYTSKINRHYLEGSFQEGLALVSVIRRLLRKHAKHIDQHRVMVFHYKIAYLYIGSGQYNDALDYLNEIINLKVGHLREDIQCYARLLQLLAHFELGNFELLEYLINSVQRFLEKLEELNAMQRETLRFLRQIIKLPEEDYKNAFLKFEKNLTKIAKDPYEKRAFLYLDMRSWVVSKLSNKPLDRVVREKYMQEHRRTRAKN